MSAATLEKPTAGSKPAPTLRPYQRDCIDAVLGSRQRLNRTLYVLPTGTGKTVTFSNIIREIRETDDRPALVLAHREELLTQAHRTLRDCIPGIGVEIEQGPQTAARWADVVIASLPTVARAGTTRLDWLADVGPSVIIYDEAHHAAADGAGRALQRFGAFENRTFLVGCTATPHRLDNKPLEGANGEAIFEECVYRYTLVQAIRDGWLCRLRGFVLRTQTDLSGVATRGGDFVEGELAKRVNDSARTEKAATHWKEIAGDRPTIVFCASVEHAVAAAEHWRAVGARAEVLHGGMSREDRRAVLDRFRAGETQVLTNCMIATEGFDHPPTACIVLLRPTKSWSLYAQMAGRGTRLSPGKADCILLDVVDNCDEHSLVTAPRLVDMPPGVDLDGGDLLEARDEMDELGARAAHLPDKPGKWKDLRTAAMEVPLFQIPATPPEIAAAGKYRWLLIPGQGYYVGCGSPKDAPRTGREAWLTEDIIGHWRLTLLEIARDEWGRKTEQWRANHTLKMSLEDAVADAERWIQHYWPFADRITNRGAKWTEGAPSESQLKLIQRLVRKHRMAGFDIAKVTTKGEASALIDSLLRTQNDGGTK